MLQLLALCAFLVLCAMPAIAAAKTYPVRIMRSDGTKFTRKLSDGKALGKLPAVRRNGRAYAGYVARYEGSSKVFKVSKKTKIHFHGINKKLLVGPRLKVSLNFSEQGGSSVKNAKFGYMNKLPKPKRAGYVFKGWYTKKNGKGTYIGTTIMNRNLTSSRKVYAKWGKAPAVVPAVNPTAVLFPKSPNVRPIDLSIPEAKEEMQAVVGMLGLTYTPNGMFAAEILEADKKKCEFEIIPKPTNATITWSAVYYTPSGETFVKKSVPNQAGSTGGVLLPIESEDLIVFTYTVKVGSAAKTYHALINVLK